jgi:hypothetical protein
MAPILARDAKHNLCAAMGLDPWKVASMTIHIEPNDIVRIDVKLYPEDNPTVNAAILAVAVASGIEYTTEAA